MSAAKKLTFECPDCSRAEGGYYTRSEAKFAQHLMDEHAYRPGQTGNEIARQMSKAQQAQNRIPARCVGQPALRCARRRNDPGWRMAKAE